MPKIHFASLFGADLDADIAIQWCRHYAAMNYDTYTVFLHSLDPDSARFHFLKRGFCAWGFSVHSAPAEPYTTQMRNDLLDRFAQSLNPLDYLCVADSDEFHTPGPWAANFRDLIMSCDCLHGTLVDRWADSLHEACLSPSLAEQYPHAGDVFKIVYALSDDPEKGRWRVPNPNKILAARAGLPVSHAGSHTLYHRTENLKERRGCVVEHYKWRHNILDRLKTKWYHHEGYARAIAEYFQLEGVPA
jgi:hypothetical protein